LANSVHSGQVYKWVDKNGQVHITQAPPPGVDSEQVTQQGGKRDDPAQHKYCAAVQRVARQIASGALSGYSMDGVLGEARAVESELIALGATSADIRQIVFFVYGMQAGLRRRQVTPDSVAKLAQDHCLSGNFAVIRGKPKSGGTGEAEDPVPASRSGTGRFVAEDRVVTSLHVVDGARTIRLYLADGGTASARIAMTDRRHDLAILSTAPRAVRPLSLRTQPMGLGAAVFTIGFPHSDVMGFRPKLANGVIASTTGVQDDVASYQISVPVQAGNSGGPLLDMSGQVVGIVAAKLRAERMYATTGDLTENVNYAIKANFIAELIGVGSGVAQAGPQSLEALASEIQPSVVRIVATR
ncbi:MAG: trypsin-like peptidase domain-containing protein, partial [Xanthomonadales bacterium]|nr:trypsin-like peptidase domain-containing protein [Xanthomonadales bacterium]